MTNRFEQTQTFLKVFSCNPFVYFGLTTNLLLSVGFSSGTIVLSVNFIVICSSLLPVNPEHRVVFCDKLTLPEECKKESLKSAILEFEYTLSYCIKSFTHFLHECFRSHRVNTLCFVERVFLRLQTRYVFIKSDLFWLKFRTGVLLGSIFLYNREL